MVISHHLHILIGNYRQILQDLAHASCGCDDLKIQEAFKSAIIVWFGIIVIAQARKLRPTNLIYRERTKPA